MDKYKLYKLTHAELVDKVLQMDKDFRTLTESNKTIIKLNGVLLEDLEEIKKLLNASFTYDSLSGANYDAGDASQAREIASKY